MIEVVLLEFDGVLADTAGARQDALLGALADDGLTLDPETYLERCAGLAPADAVREARAALAAPPDETAIELASLRAERAFAERLAGGVSLRPGAREFVRSLVGRTRAALVSRAGRRNVERLLALSDIADVFEIVVTADDVGATAAPGTHRLALDRLRVRRAVPPARAIALEDGPAGIRAARAVGLRCVAVGPLPPHQALEADGYLPSLEGETLDTLAQVAARRDERVR